MITNTASLGARLLSPKSSTQVGWTIRKGYDFPPEITRQLETWGLTLSIIQENECPSTRGQLKYLDSTLASNPSAFTRLGVGVLTAESSLSQILQIPHPNLDHPTRAPSKYTPVEIW